MSTDKACWVARGDLRINPQASDCVQGGSFASRQERAFDSASLTENLQNPARMGVIAGSERRVTTALRSGSDAAREQFNAGRGKAIP